MFKTLFLSSAIVADSVAAESLFSGLLSSVSHAQTVLASERSQAFIDLDVLEANKGSLEVGSNTDLKVIAQENRSTGFSWVIT
mmetsp:Transcript_8893/g.15090  ORF Transcript_8893/g.15090 Transcript_8893/m.15090 type:complete len:83 (+) Transcript_8893:45-293(+)